MLQHMQYTVDKRVYFLYSALLNHKHQEQRQQHQQSAATMPSKPAVTGKFQCFKNPTPLTSAAVGCVRSHIREGLQEQRRAYSKLVLCTPKKKGWKVRWSAHTARHSTHNPADSLVPFRLNTRSPQQQLIVQLLFLVDSLDTELQQLKLCLVG